MQPGLLLGDRYRLNVLLAIGGMGEVWRAHDETLGRDVAVKVLKPEYAEDPSFVERFRAEARHTAMLTHPGIATVYDYGELTLDDRAGDGSSGTMAYLVMELVPGEPLSALLAREGRLPSQRTMRLVGQAALALQAAHERGIVHRDVKPGNLIVTADDTVKVTDFGIARVADAVPLTRTGTVLGTSFYLSPEQAAGHDVTAVSDVYSLGVVAYECLAGRRPFQHDNPLAVALAHQTERPPPLPDDVPPHVASLVMAALAKDPQRRPKTAGEFARAALVLADDPFADTAATQAMGAGAAATVPLGARTTTGATRAYTRNAAPAPVRRAAPPPSARRPPPARRHPLPSPPPPRRRRRRLRMSVPLIGLLALAALLVVALVRSGQNKTPSPQTSTTSATVTVPNYVGYLLGYVRTQLTSKGLQVSVSGSTSSTAIVDSISPTGQVRAGSTVYVHAHLQTATVAPTTPTASQGAPAVTPSASAPTHTSPGGGGGGSSGGSGGSGGGGNSGTGSNGSGHALGHDKKSKATAGTGNDE